MSTDTPLVDTEEFQERLMAEFKKAINISPNAGFSLKDAYIRNTFALREKMRKGR